MNGVSITYHTHLNLFPRILICLQQNIISKIYTLSDILHTYSLHKKLDLSASVFKEWKIDGYNLGCKMHIRNRIKLESPR